LSTCDMATILNRFRRRVSDPGTEMGPGNSTRDSSSHEPSDNHSPAEHVVRGANPEKHDLEAKGGASVPITSGDDDEDNLPEDIRELPKIVRNTCSMEDDPNAPTITFRYFLLCALFVPPGAFLYQMGSFRTTAAIYPVMFVQIGIFRSPISNDDLLNE
jgi:hypothetical protein